MRKFFLSVILLLSVIAVFVQVRIFPLNVRDIIYIARWWEKYLWKCSLIQHTSSWCDKLIAFWRRTWRLPSWFGKQCTSCLGYSDQYTSSSIFSLFHSNGCLWILYQTWDVLSALVVATYFFAAHPLDPLKTCWCINNLCIWMQTFVNNKLFGSLRWIHLNFIHKFGSMACLKFGVFSECISRYWA